MRFIGVSDFNAKISFDVYVSVMCVTFFFLNVFDVWVCKHVDYSLQAFHVFALLHLKQKQIVTVNTEAILCLFSLPLCISDYQNPRRYEFTERPFHCWRISGNKQTCVSAVRTDAWSFLCKERRVCVLYVYILIMSTAH